VDKARTGHEALVLVIFLRVPVEVRDIGADEHEVALLYKVDLVADKSGAFGLVDQDEFVFLMEVPGFVKIVTFPINVNKGRVRR
jgi:hypothetical protein